MIVLKILAAWLIIDVIVCIANFWFWEWLGKDDFPEPHELLRYRLSYRTVEAARTHIRP